MQNYMNIGKFDLKEHCNSNVGSCYENGMLTVICGQRYKHHD